VDDADGVSGFQGTANLLNDPTASFGGNFLFSEKRERRSSPSKPLTPSASSPDLKPQKRHADKSGRVLVMDFGMARTLEGDGMTQSGA